MITKPRIRKLTKAAGVTLLAFLLSWVVAYDFTSLSYFAPLEKASDFIASDFYTLVANGSGVKRYDPDITVVSLDNLSRNEIADAFELIASAGPAVTAIDLILQCHGDDTDIRLMEAIASLGTVVRPEIYYPDNYTGVPDSRFAGTSIYEYLDNVYPGVINLETRTARGIIRDFRPIFGEDKSMAAKAVELFNPGAFENLMSRGNQTEKINFESTEFDIITPDVISRHPETIKGRIIFAGVTDDLSDIHATPIDETFPGILIHAASASTMLQRCYINPVPKWIEWGIAMLLCILFILLHFRTSSIKGGDMIMRWLQAGMLVLMVVASTMLYLSTHYALDLTLPLLMIMLGLLADDLWTLAETMPSRIRSLYSRVKKLSVKTISLIRKTS